MSARRWPEIVFAGDAPRQTLSAAARRGRLRRLASGIYTGLPLDAPERVVLRNWRQILAREFEGAVLGDRSARAMQPDRRGRLFVIHPRKRPLELPGLTIVPRKGPGPLAGDTSLDSGLWLSSTARGLLDNAGGRGERYLLVDELESWVSDLVQTHGEERLNLVRDQARDLARHTGRDATFARLNRIISAALATGPAGDVVSDALRARASGQPYDRARVDLFRSFVAILEAMAPEPLPALPVDEPRRRLLPFYEAYFSNYIEGTELTIDEAAEIVFELHIPETRLADAHDILGTYRLVQDGTEMSRTPATAARVDFSSRATAERDLTRTNALREPNEAEDAGVRLTLPGPR